ncbi:hypothetical protein P171DRAFT_430892 [Karstenula rhodostoma CBS 690.94]|uniref:Uncharacterized protein n=1 Tax=Karstenula rhodostoma CBS 690.94 TaxID=1392251 RepID=A0A9P4PMF1_9PLEO|nr:hypothetical protein P171DRAFT_430892 [Karstenula rhodostoma CBS 690.94]
MFCRIPFIVVFAACVSSAVSETLEFNLFAYGKLASSGLQLFYGDGQAYVGGAPSFVKESVNISLVMVEGGDKFVARANTTSPAWPTEPTMYVDLTEGAAISVGFTTDNKTLPDGATSVGFGLYGGWVFHKQDDADIEMKFLATPTNETGIYLVKWNAASTKTRDAIPISLRTQAPVVFGDK